MIIGLDVGGTNTDVVLLGNTGLLRDVKVTTDPADLFSSVLSGLEKITEGIRLSEIRRIVLSTTLTTNAIVQNKIPPVGMIVSSGPGINSDFFRTNDHYFTVDGSIDHRGREIEAVNLGQIRDVGKRLKKEGVRYAGVVGKFSIRNPEHEIAIAGALQEYVETVFMGHRISGNLNFPRRVATTYINAAVYPIHRDFFLAVKRSLETKGLRIPMDILKADGGTMSLDSSIDSPGQTVLSGPAASVMGAIVSAPASEDVVILDIGGTTTDMAILIDRTPVLDPLGIAIGPFCTLIRSLNTRSIGLGGDSVVRVVDGRLDIGPDRIGPAMAFGGPVPTPTDAMVVLGKLRAEDPEAARRGIDSVARAIGKGAEETALLIFNEVCTRILAEIHGFVDRINSKPVYTVHELLEGYRVNPKKIMIIGGPAPQFVEHLGKISEFTVQLVPRWEVANAIGAALARTTCEVTLFADTQLGILTAPEEKISRTIGSDYSKSDAISQAFDLLKQKALLMGASMDDLEVEILEESQFNMVRGFYTTGKNIRVKVQVKPGLIREKDAVDGILAEAG